MGWLNSVLEPGEKVLLRVRHHWAYNLPRLGLPNLSAWIAITDRRVIHAQGIVAVTMRDIDHSQIELRELSQSILGRVLGYGDLTLSGAGGQMITLHCVAQAGQVMRQISGARKRSAARGSAKRTTLPEAV